MIAIGLNTCLSIGRGGSVKPNDSPSNLVLTTVDDTHINGTFDSSATNADGYKLYKSTDGITYAEHTSVTWGTLSFAASGLSMYTKYWLKVCAYKGSKLSEFCTAVTEYTAWKGVLTSTGTGAGVSTIRLKFITTDVVATLDGNGKFYSDAAGTLNESASYTFTAGSLVTRYLKVTSGTSNLLVFAKGNWTQFGDISNTGWISSTNAASIALSLTNISLLTDVNISGTCVISNAMPPALIRLILIGAGIAYTYNGDWPSTVTYLYISGNSIAWTSSNTLPSGLTFLLIEGNLIDWTGLNIGNSGNITLLSLKNYRVSKMSSTDMVTLLTQMTNRTGTLPSTITINDYTDYASPPTAVTNAVNALKAAKSVTTVTLGA